MKGDSNQIGSDVQLAALRRIKGRINIMKKLTVLMLIVFIAFILAVPTLSSTKKITQPDIYYDKESVNKVMNVIFHNDEDDDTPPSDPKLMVKSPYTKSRTGSRRGKRSSIFEY